MSTAATGPARRIAFDSAADLQAHAAVAEQAAAAGLHVPRALEADPDARWLLVTDLGDRSLLHALQQGADAADADRLMRRALHTLVRWQQLMPVASLPRCDAARLQGELALFAQRCVQQRLGLRWSDTQRAAWQRCCDLLVDSALAQPMVAVHGDWTARNLIVGDGEIGIVGFARAFAGPISCDLATLLRDEHLLWDEEQELDWAVRWWQQACAAGLPVEPDFGDFWRAFEWMGLQRHLHALGEACGLNDDGAPVSDTPGAQRLLAHATRVALRYGVLKPLLGLLEPLSGQGVRSGYTF